jgi:hypothetical protein
MSEPTPKFPPTGASAFARWVKKRFNSKRCGVWASGRRPRGLREQVAFAEAEVKRLDREIAPLRAQLRKIEGDMARAADVQSALDQIRRQRIERVKAAREARKIARGFERVDRERSGSKTRP